MSQTQAYTLSQLGRHISNNIARDPNLQNVWVVGETVDVRLSGGHCYFDLVEKDPSTGRPLAKARATIWQSTFYRLAADFLRATGQNFRSDLKVMACVCVNYHPLFGMSLNVVAIDPTYTLGDAMQRRAQLIERLRQDGIIDMNRTLPWPRLVQRIAIISAQGAAGYGDFIHQLYTNNSRLRFATRLFSAVLQGERTAPTIISALEEIHANIDDWDCVVIIRGGGATTDLAAFDDYALAANIAQFPIPVIIGIGHERDITLLDYVANMRVKTPTAAAEWLIAKAEQELGLLQQIASAMLQAVSDRMVGHHRQLAFIQGQIPSLALNVLTRAQNRLINLQSGIASISDRRLRPEMEKLNGIAQAVSQAAEVAIQRADSRLKSIEELLSALSPQATLRRGYTITRIAGRAARAADLRPGEILETTFLDGTAYSQLISATPATAATASGASAPDPDSPISR